MLHLRKSWLLGVLAIGLCSSCGLDEEDGSAVLGRDKTSAAQGERGGQCLIKTIQGQTYLMCNPGLDCVDKVKPSYTSATPAAYSICISPSAATFDELCYEDEECRGYVPFTKTLACIKLFGSKSGSCKERIKRGSLCRVSADCVPGDGCCQGRCVSLTSVEHCGTCDNQCGLRQACSLKFGGQCVAY
jgi:hypothetical protein